MSGWLAPLKRNFGAMNLASHEAQDVISQGVDIIMRYRHNPMMPQYVYGSPQPGIPVVDGEKSLEKYLVDLVATCVRASRWGGQRFYYPCMDVPRVTYTSAWRAMQSGLARHNVSPLLTHEKDIHQFHGVDWLICTVNIVLN